MDDPSASLGDSGRSSRTFTIRDLSMFRWQTISRSLLILLLCFVGSSGASDPVPPDERSLDKTVLRINEQLQAEYAVLDPAPITVGRFREAVAVAIERLAKSDKKDRMLIVRALQVVLAEECLPAGYHFYLSATSASFKKQSLEDDVLGKKVVNLRYHLSVPVPVGKATTQPVRLRSLAEQFFIEKKEIVWSD